MKYFIIGLHFIFILGSICDMTDRVYDVFGHRSFWPPSDIQARINQVLTIMDEMANNAKLIGSHTKACFLPENRMDVNAYNGISDPIPWKNLTTQHELERGFIQLQRKARFLNNTMNIVTPRSLDITHSRRNGRLRPVYGKLYDGLHFSRPVARHLACILNECDTFSSLPHA